MSGRNGGGGDPPTNPMPPLIAAVREALTESIREHGVIVPVVKDQTGYVLDGYNRIAIAAFLDVTAPEVVHECEPAQREILRIELNGARRQVTSEEWKPLVDHLRTQVDESGVRRFSDRVIARAVGVDRHIVQRHKSPVDINGPSGPLISKTGQEDGRVRNSNSEWTAIDRVLHLIRQSTVGVTTDDLLLDEVMRGFAHSTGAMSTSKLRDRGLIVATGKRGRSIIWQAVPEGEVNPPATNTVAARKAQQIIGQLADTEVRDEVKAQLADTKGTRQAEVLLRQAEREMEAARLAEEKREAEIEKEQLRLIEIARDQADKSVKAWDKLIAEVRSAWVLIAAYSKVFDDLPAIHPSFCRMLDSELVELRQQMEWFDRKLHPEDRGTLHRDTVIDV